MAAFLPSTTPRCGHIPENTRRSHVVHNEVAGSDVSESKKNILRLVFTVLLTVGSIVISIGIMLMSIHGPESSPAFALAYFLIGNAIWWWAFTRFRRKGAPLYYTLLGGVGFIALGFGAGAVPHVFDSAFEEYKLTRTVVSDVRDELLLSEQGNPIGVRLRFTLRFPMEDYYWIEPHLQPPNGLYQTIAGRMPERVRRMSPLDLEPIAKSVEPYPHALNADRVDDLFFIGAFSLRFKKNVDYQFTFDLAPTYFKRKPKEPGMCFVEPNENNWPNSREAFEALIQVDVEVPYRVSINGTTYGDRFREPGEMLTSESYNPGVFHEGIQAETPGPCAETENYY